MSKVAGTVALLALAATGSPSMAAQNAPSYANDPDFQASFDMYWRARLLGSYAGNRVCALPDSTYDSPKSPFRPIDERLRRAEIRFEKRFPTALNNVARPYQMPPSQSKCDDASAAWESIFAFATAVAGLENLLNRIDRK